MNFPGIGKEEYWYCNLILITAILDLGSLLLLTLPFFVIWTCNSIYIFLPFWWIAIRYRKDLTYVENISWRIMLFHVSFTVNNYLSEIWPLYISACCRVWLLVRTPGSISVANHNTMVNPFCVNLLKNNALGHCFFL